MLAFMHYTCPSRATSAAAISRNACASVEFGAACTQGTDFKFAVARGEKVEMMQAKEL